MMTNSRWEMSAIARMLLPAGVLLLTACDEGSIRLSVTDAPADEVEAVVVQFAAVEFENSAGDWERIEIEPPLRVDLLALRGQASRTLIEAEDLPAEQYRTIRFDIEADGNGGDSYVDEADGSRVALELEGGENSKPSVSFRFNLDEGDDIALTVDFDLRKALLEPEGFGDPYLLRSELRVVEDDQVGSVSGTVASSLIGSACEPALYVFDGEDADPDDIGSANEPVTSVGLVRSNGSSGVNYNIGFLEAGRYTLALTCEAHDDRPDADDDISFDRERNFEIEEERETRLDIS